MPERESRNLILIKITYLIIVNHLLESTYA